jgi:hypothetical protein
LNIGSILHFLLYVQAWNVQTWNTMGCHGMGTVPWQGHCHWWFLEYWINSSPFTLCSSMKRSNMKHHGLPWHGHCAMAGAL